MADIQEAQRFISPRKATAITHFSVLLALGFSLLLFNFKSVSLRDFVLSVVSIIGVVLVSGILIGISENFLYSGRDKKMFLAVLSFGIILFTFLKVKGISNAKTYSKFLTICTVGFSFFAPFSILWLFAVSDMLGFINLNNFVSYSQELFVMNLVFAGTVFYLAVAMPWLRNKFVRLQSLPRG